ncbi:MAG TPA: hypothetical protein V6C95_18555 [Coleofasciculaceae cyanobacterium]
MTKLTRLELAKQGDEAAIISVMNYLLKDKGITAKSAQKGDCLLVVLKASQVPEQKSSVTLIKNLMMKLEVPSVKSVKVYGKQTGQPSPAWMESLDLTPTPLIPEKQTVFSYLIPLNHLKLRREKLFLIPLVFLAATAGYLLSKLPVFQDIFPVPIASQTSLRVTPTSATPSPTRSETPAQLPQSDPFREAVNAAMSAATLTQSAQSPDDWNTIAAQWQKAITLMKTVPTSSPNYTVAQKKVGEYQINLDYAQKAASRTQKL